MNLNPPREKEDARELEGIEGVVGVVGEARLVTLAFTVLLERCRCICRLFASALSCVRTKLARLYRGER
jgi:hypothetical protein